MTLANTIDQTAMIQRGPNLPDPASVMKFQGQCANALMDVIKQQDDNGRDNKFLVKISGKDYLTFEAWQTIAQLNGCSVIVDQTSEITDSNDVVIAYDSWASVIEKSTGLVVARANMECGMTSFPTQGKLGREKNKAAKSASQTWAGAKACRMAFSFVAVLAGYEPTPADEMPQGGTGIANERPQLATENDNQLLRICPVHNQEWRQSQKQKEPAHRTDNGWCNQSPTLNPILASMLEDTSYRLGWSKGDLAPWIKKNFSLTWSGLSPRGKLEALDKLGLVLASQTEDHAGEPTTVDEETGEILESVTGTLSEFDSSSVVE
jgi:hypothetical protein